MGEPLNAEAAGEPGASVAAGLDPAGQVPAIEPDAALQEALAESARLKEEWLRAKAETENVRRRAQEDVTKAHKFGIESFAAALLPVKDALDAALAVESPTLESLQEGVALTGRQVEAAFERFSLLKIAPAAGEKFDPHRHQAISQVESDQEPNTVVALLQAGFRLHDRVLRPALVTVAKARV